MSDEDYNYMIRCLHKGVAEPEQQWDAYDRIKELEAENADLKASLAKAVHRFAAKAVRSMTQVDEAFENWNKKQDEEAFIKLGAALVSNHETLAELTGGNKDDN